MRTMRANHPQTFYTEWLKRDANGLAIARIIVSYEDTRNILKRVKMGKANELDGEFAKVNHLNLLKRMIKKNWVEEKEINKFYIY